MILDEIKAKLEEVDTNVYYGMVDEAIRETVWDCTVFARTKLKATANKTGYTDGYDVLIIRENFIPDGTDLEIISKMLEIDGMRLSSEDGVYTYIQKPNTNIVVEMLALHFVRARK